LLGSFPIVEYALPNAPFITIPTIIVNQQRWKVNLSTPDPTTPRLEAMTKALEQQVLLITQVLAKTRAKLSEESTLRIQQDQKAKRLEKELLESKTTIEGLRFQLSSITPPSPQHLTLPLNPDSQHGTYNPSSSDTIPSPRRGVFNGDLQSSPYPVDLKSIIRDYPSLQTSQEGLPYSEWASHGYSPLMVDAMFGNLQSMIYHASFDPSAINTTSKHGETPIMLASEFGRLDCVKWLVSKGQTTRNKDFRGLSPLLLSSFNGHAHLVDWLLTNGSSLYGERYGEDQSTVVHIAAQYGYLEILSVALKHHPKALFGTNARGESPIHVAVRAGQVKVVQWIVGHGGSLTVKDNKGLTPLLTAVMQGQLDMVKWLISMGSSVEEDKDSDGSTPFILACFLGNLELVQWMAQRDAHLQNVRASLTNSTGEEYSGDGESKRQTEKESPPDGELDIPSSTLIESCNTDGNTPLMVAALSGASNVVDWLLSKGARVKRRNAAGNTAFHLSCYGGHLSCMEKLWNAIDSELKKEQELEERSTVDKSNNLGSSQLISGSSDFSVSSHISHHEPTRLVITSPGLTSPSVSPRPLQNSFSIQISSQDLSSLSLDTSTAMTSESLNQSLEPTPEFRGGAALSALPPMFLDDDNPMVSSLPPPPPPDDEYPYADELTESSDPTEPFREGQRGDLKDPMSNGSSSLSWIPHIAITAPTTHVSTNSSSTRPLDTGSDEVDIYPPEIALPSPRSPESDSPRKPHTKKQGSKVKSPTKKIVMDAPTMARARKICADGNGQGSTPVLITCLSGHLEALKWLLSRGSSRKEVDSAGMNTLLMASIGGHVKIAQFLIAASSKSSQYLVNESNSEGFTPLLLASYTGQAEMVRFLLSNGANPRRTNAQGSGPLSLAAINGHLHILQILIEHGATVRERSHAAHCALLVGRKDVSIFLKERAYSHISRPLIKVR
jgi:ankyrin repeat protein